jgi:hypothetical protein
MTKLTITLLAVASLAASGCVYRPVARPASAAGPGYAAPAGPIAPMAPAMMPARPVRPYSLEK